MTEPIDPALLARYQTMHDEGISAPEVFKTIKADGIGLIETFVLIKQIFGFSLVEAKEAYVLSEGYASLDEFQSQIAENIEIGLSELENNLDDESEG